MSVNEIDNAPEIKPKHYSLSLRGGNINDIVDAATPLLGMILRIKDIDSLDSNPNIYHQVVNDINVIEQTLQSKQYEPGVVVSFRYILCTFIDEIAMKHSWDSKSNWRKESLLVHFHNEAWGGEKIFVLLDRLMGEPHRYKDLLNFIYLCFCLGLRGRYALSPTDTDEFNKIMTNLYQQLHAMEPQAGSTTLNISFGKINNSHYKLPKKIAIKHILGYGFLFLILIYTFFAFNLNHQCGAILSQLNELLK